MVAGLYIDRQILAATKMVRLPDGQMKLEQDMTEGDVWIDFEKDFGYGMQYFIPRKYFTKHENFKG